MMLVDTDVLIWNLRGNANAADTLDALSGFHLSAITYMELAQGARNKQELRTIHQALHFWAAETLPLTPAISSRASYLVEQHALANSMQLADALIAATALEHGLDLLTANDKHYRPVNDLVIQIFRP